ncbi:type IV pilin [Psychromonas sp. CNPT3]|uniref:prepilin-type N-terminal cleavage/methylation domain-containing protein n=1 Tax=Psychromonas sp. CNPT3 TaxID=314282 RepID=UPI00006E711C|nr:prepilin-type N-terminal cleavage/methylation domain-containing protein [Psychromonas sp. CNPT3]AGH81937.1 type IV pilin [Psychromonas sp. CNPT3]
MYKIKYKAFTLIELLVALSILSLLLSLSIRGYDALVTPQLLRARVEHVYHFLRSAHAKAITLDKKVYVYFCNPKSPRQWEMLMSTLSRCDCLSPSSCLLEGRKVSIELSDAKSLFVEAHDITFTGKRISYMPMRFRINAGSITISDKAGRRLKIIQSIQRLKVCAPHKTLWSYKKC